MKFFKICLSFFLLICFQAQAMDNVLDRVAINYFNNDEGQCSRRSRSITGQFCLGTFLVSGGLLITRISTEKNGLLGLALSCLSGGTLICVAGCCGLLRRVINPDNTDDPERGQWHNLQLHELEPMPIASDND